MEGKASDPAAWPQPFTIDGSNTMDLVEFEPGHFVRADPSRAQSITAAAS
jgi:peptide/nickel transport system ATP-binding protein